MDPTPYREPSPGLHDEERRRQLSAELEHAERERRAALLWVAEAEARAKQVRDALADVASKPVQNRPEVTETPGKRTQGPHVVDVHSASISGALLGRSGSTRVRREALLERFLEARDRQGSRRRILVLSGIAVVLAGVLVTSRVAPLGEIWERVYSRWILPQVRPEGEQGPPIPLTPELQSNPNAAAIVLGFVSGVLADIDLGDQGTARVAPADSWLTATYRVRPTGDPSVRAHGRALVAEATGVQAAIPPLVDAGLTIRAEFSAAGIDSEGLEREAVNVYQTAHRVLGERVGAKVALGEAIIALDAHLRAHQGSLTYRLGEYDHRDTEVAREAADLEASVTRTAAALVQAEALARTTIRDLGVPGR